jgi:acetyltransferase-like isoleucine patch superfamily enzyme
VIHATAIVADDARLAADVQVGPLCVLGIDGPDGIGPLEIAAATTVRSHAVIYRDVTVGTGSHVGHGALVREATRIGAHVSIGSHSIVEHHVSIADHVRLHSRCFVPEHSVLQEGCWLGPGVIVTNARYPNRSDTKDRLEGVVVEKGAVIGAGAVLLPGITIGTGALVGAGAVVVRDVEPGRTVVGNPARPVS